MKIYCTAGQTQDSSDATSRALYRNAIAGQWRLDEALDWSRLNFDKLTSSIRGAMALVYGDVLFAETFGIEVTTRMAELAPEGWMREFAVTQVQDETRHAEFFGRVMEKLGGPQDTSMELETLRDELRRTADYDELMLHGQIVETAARVLFVGNGTRSLELMAKSVRLPGAESASALLRAMVHLVGRDEARHIAFGLHCLRKRLASCDAAQRHNLEQRASVTARLMYQAFAKRSTQYERLGWPADDVLARTWETLRTQLGRLQLDLGDAERKTLSEG